MYYYITNTQYCGYCGYYKYDGYYNKPIDDKLTSKYMCG